MFLLCYMRKRVHLYRRNGTDLLGDNFTQTGPTGMYILGCIFLASLAKHFVHKTVEIIRLLSARNKLVEHRLNIALFRGDKMIVTCCCTY